MKGSIEYLKIVSMLIIAMFLLVGTGVAYLDDYIVLDTFADGQPSHIMQNHELSTPIPDPWWTCPPDEIMITDDVAAQDDTVAPSLPCYIPRPKLTHERQELWLNPYSQIIKMQYPDKYREQDRKLSYKIPETEAEAVSDANWASYYIDASGAVVSYYAEQIIQSNRSLESPIDYPPGYDAIQAMNDLNLTKQEFLDVSNHEKIKAEAYNHSYEAQEMRMKELNEQLEDAKLKNNELEALNETVAQQAGVINRILDWILETFGIDLR